MDFRALESIPYPALMFTIVWELIWKGLALWKAVKNNSRKWFVILLVVNSIGILPILYLLFFQPKKNKDKSTE